MGFLKSSSIHSFRNQVSAIPTEKQKFRSSENVYKDFFRKFFKLFPEKNLPDNYFKVSSTNSSRDI